MNRSLNPSAKWSAFFSSISALLILVGLSTQAHGAGLRLMAVGDSVTAGYLSTSGDGYRGPLYYQLISQGDTVEMVGSQRGGSMFNSDNEGHYGYQISQLAGIINADLATYQPNVVLLDIGINDLNGGYEVSTASNRLASLIDQIIAADPTVTLLVAQLGCMTNPNVQTLINTYNSQIISIVQTRASEGEHIYMVNMGALTLSDLADGLHPNDIGYQLMADAWDAGLQQVIAKGWVTNINFPGVYELQCKASGLAVDVDGASSSAGASILQWPYDSGWNQQWGLIPSSNGYYQIINLNSGLDLAVTGASTTAGALIIQEEYGTTGEDQWLPVQQSDGSYTFQNLNSGLFLDDPDGNTKQQTQFDQADSTGGTNQKFILTQQAAFPTAPPVAAGTYALVVHSTGMCLAANGAATADGTALVQNAYNGAGNELWNVTPVGDGQYYAIGIPSGRAVTVSGSSTAAGAAIELYDYSSSFDELFTLQATANSGYYNIIFVNSGLTMTVSGGSTTSGAAIVQDHTNIGATDAMWQFQAETPAVATGTYSLLVNSTGMALQAQDKATTSLTPLVQSPYDGDSSEEWDVTSLGNGQYSAIGGASDLSVNIDGGSKSDNAPLILYSYNGASNELFTLNPTGTSGYYNVDFVNSNLAMSVLDASTTSGAAIVQNTPGATSDEEWEFQPAPPLLATGTYSLVVNSTGMCLAASGGGTSTGTALVQSPYTGLTSELWNVTPVGNGEYDAIGVQSSLSISVPGSSTTSNTALQLNYYVGATNDLFTLQATPTAGYYNLIMVNSGLALAVEGASTTSGADIVQYTVNTATNELWQFQPQEPVLTTGTYALLVNSTGMALAASNGNTASLTPLVQSPYDGDNSELWNVTALGNGIYSAVGVASGLAVNVDAGSTASNAPLLLYNYNGQYNERFTLQATSTSGYYNVVFLNSGLNMAVQNASSTAGADIVQYTPDSDANEEWTFQPQ
jgi:lysophospholipase L1-like esterase